MPGLVCVINMQAWLPECCNCGKAVTVEADLRHSRHVTDGGIIGYSPWCLRCWAKYGRHDDEPETPAKTEEDADG